MNHGPDHHLFKHGEGSGSQGTRSPEWLAWASMRWRCNNPRHKFYRHYGGRGITICARWQESFNNFLSDMGRRPSPRHSLDRIDNNKGYSPENCRWALPETQNTNRRVVHAVTIGEQTLTLPEWSRRSGINLHTLKGRYHRGVRGEALLQRAVRGGAH